MKTLLIPSAMLYREDNNPAGKVFTDYPVYQLAAVLERNRLEAVIPDLTNASEIEPGELARKVRGFPVVCLSADSLNWSFAKETAGIIKRAFPDIVIIAGGVHPSLFPRRILSDENIDFAVIGEGEITLPALLLQLKKGVKGNFDNLPGIAYKSGSSIIINSPRKLLNDKSLEESPQPLYKYMTKTPGRIFTLETSRGYPFYSPFHSIPHHRGWRFISPVSVYERAYNIYEHLMTDGDCGYIQLLDDCFTAKPKRLYDLRSILLKKKKDYRFAYFSRCSDLIDGELAKIISCFTEKAVFTPYCGYNKGLIHLGKGFMTETIERCAGNLCKNRIGDRGEFTFMVGLPWENLKMCHSTLSFAERLREKYNCALKIQWFRLLPNTAFWDNMEKQGLADPSVFDHYSPWEGSALESLSCVNLSPQDRIEINERIAGIS